MLANPHITLSRLSLLSVLIGFSVAGPWIATGLSISQYFALQSPNSSTKRTASPASAGIRQIALTTKDLVYDPIGQRIYASLPGSAPNGNSIVQIDPVAGTVGTPVPMGSEPGRLAISDNSQFIYASLDGAAAV